MTFKSILSPRAKLPIEQGTYLKPNRKGFLVRASKGRGVFVTVFDSNSRSIVVSGPSAGFVVVI